MQIAQGVGLSLVHFVAMWPVRVNKMSHTQSLSVGFMEKIQHGFQFPGTQEILSTVLNTC